MNSMLAISKCVSGLGFTMTGTVIKSRRGNAVSAAFNAALKVPFRAVPVASFLGTDGPSTLGAISPLVLFLGTDGPLDPCACSS